MNEELKAWLRSYGVDPDTQPPLVEKQLPTPRPRALEQRTFDQRVVEANITNLQPYALGKAAHERGLALYVSVDDVLALSSSDGVSNVESTPIGAAQLHKQACWCDVSRPGMAAVDAPGRSMRWLLSWSVGGTLRLDEVDVSAPSEHPRIGEVETWRAVILTALHGWRAALPDGDALNWTTALGDGHTLSAAWCRIGLLRWIRPLDANEAVAAALRGELVSEQEEVRLWASALTPKLPDHVDRELCAALGQLDHELQDIDAQLKTESASGEPAARFGFAMERGALLSAGAALLWSVEGGLRSADASEALQEQGIELRERLTPTLSDVVRRRLSGLPASPDDWWVP